MMSKILRRWVLPLAALALAFAGGMIFQGEGCSAGDETAVPDDHDHVAEASVWTCSMHPQIKLPEQGQCPICFMDLIPLDLSGQATDGPRAVSMSAAAMALAEIATVTVRRQTVRAEVRLSGKIVYDETRYRTISARVPGRIDRLFVDHTGAAVHRGQKLVSLYSPDLVAAQTELLSALTARREVAGSSSDLTRTTSAATVAAARNRLRLWGLDDDQITAIEAVGEPALHLDVPSPLAGVVVHKSAVEGMYVAEGTPLYTVADLSTIWVELDAYESDLAWLALDQTVHFTATGLPGRTLSGRVVFLDPVLNERTRTVRVRLEADNSLELLKPGMFVSATIDATQDTGSRHLLIPASAPLITGKRAVVYVRVPDRDQPTFEGREVVLGPRTGNHYIVAAGLDAGEEVVVKGNFKLDSALQIQAKPSMMNPQREAPVQGESVGSLQGRGLAAGAGVTETPEGFQQALGDVLAAYLDAQAALAADDDVKAGRAAAEMVTALSRVGTDDLDPVARDRWQQDLHVLRPATKAFAAALHIDARREVLGDLSPALWATLRHFGTDRREPPALFHCPMAFNDTGADWLQIGKTTNNPYFGASMLRCGWQTASLSVEAGGEGDR